LEIAVIEFKTTKCCLILLLKSREKDKLEKD